MKLKTWIALLGLLLTQLLLTTAATEKPRYAPVTIEASCGIGDTIAFKGLAYFCYKDPVSGYQLYRSNGGEENWEAVTSFSPKITSPINALFTTQSDLFFLAGGVLYRTNGQPGNYVKIGGFSNGSGALTHIASDAGTHFLRSGQYLYAAGNTPGSIRLLGSTTLISGLYTSDVIYFNGYLYFVSSSSSGYWNRLERVNRNGNRQLVKEFSADTDTVIEPIANDIGFTFVTSSQAGVKMYRVTSGGSVTPLNFIGTPIAKVGSKVIFKSSGANELYVTRDLDAFSPLGKSWSGNHSAFFEFDSTTIVSCNCYQYLATDGTPSGTYIGTGSALLDTVDPNAGLLLLKSSSELHFLDKNKPQQPVQIADLVVKVTQAFIRDTGSYYVLTEPDIGAQSQLWRVYRNSNIPFTLLSEHNSRIEHAVTEDQRLYFGVKGAGLGQSNSKNHLWHSGGSPESTYVLRNPAIELTLGWLSAVQLLLLEE